MRHVACLGGSDGIHLHCTENALIEDCLFKTGDDCIAGINIKNMLVRRCVLNTSCNLFRIGGVGINIEDIYAYGPGYYPHRLSVVKGKNDELPRTEGRHNLMQLIDYFASSNYPYEPSDIHFKNCVIEDAKAIIWYPADEDSLHCGTYLRELTLENVRFSDLKVPSSPKSNPNVPLNITLKNVSIEYAEGCDFTEIFDLKENSNTTVIIK